MRSAVLAEIVASARSGYWGLEPGSASDVRVVRNGDIDGAGDIRWNELPMRSLSPSEVAKARLVAHDILITISGNCGYVAYVPTTPQAETCASNFVRVVRAHPERVVQRDLFHWMNRQAFRAALQPFIRGTTLKNLSLAAAFDQLTLPLPPLDEQRRIARLLDVADRARYRRTATFSVLEELRTAVFTSCVATSNGSWPLVPVADLVDESNGGIRTGPFGSQLLHSEFVDEGVAVLGIDNAVANEFRWGVERHITEEKYVQLRRYTVHPGDVLITIMGTCGRVAIVPDDIGRAINTKHLCCITLDRSRCLPEFLHSYFLRHPIARHHLASRAKGAIMAGLNMTIIKELPVSLPPIEVQNEVVDRLAAVGRAHDRAARQRERLDSLFTSLQQRAFTGAL